jgi:hypothetical protein
MSTLAVLWLGECAICFPLQLLIVLCILLIAPLLPCTPLRNCPGKQGNK